MLHPTLKVVNKKEVCSRSDDGGWVIFFMFFEIVVEAVSKDLITFMSGVVTKLSSDWDSQR